MTQKCLAANSYPSREGCISIYISNTRFSTTSHKVFSGGHSNELDIKAILPRAPLVHFLLIELSPGLPGGGRFCDMINYASEPLAMLEIHRDTIKENYV